MDEFSFVVTIFFMLPGPVKLAGPFAGLMQGPDDEFLQAVVPAIPGRN